MNRFFAAFLSCIMCLSCLTLNVFAEDTDVTTVTSVEPVKTEIASGDFKKADKSAKDKKTTTSTTSKDKKATEEVAQSWVIDLDYTLRITGKGALNSYLDTELDEIPWSEHRDIIQKIVVDEGITSIGFNLFRDCCNVTKVSLPSTLLKIDGRAFDGCYSLQYIKIPASVDDVEMWAFANCKSLVSILFASTETKLNTSLVSYNRDVVFDGSDNVTVFCKKNSNAYKYALYCGIPYSTKTSSASNLNTLMAYAYKRGSGYINLGNKNATVSKIKNSSATISWAKVFPWDMGIQPDKYIVYSYSESKNEYIPVAETSKTSCTIKSLTAGRTYKLKVVPILNGVRYDDEYRVVVQFKAK